MNQGGLLVNRSRKLIKLKFLTRQKRYMLYAQGITEHMDVQFLVGLRQPGCNVEFIPGINNFTRF